MLTSLTTAWRGAWTEPGFKARIVATVVFTAVAAVSFSTFVQFVQTRPGAVLDDPVLPLLPRVDVTWLTFSIIYGSVIVALVSLAGHPHRMLVLIQTYAGMLLVRLVAMYLIPLDPPPDMIALADPVARVIFAAEEAPTRDLFFSGHTASLVTLVLTARTPRLRALFVVATAAVATCVLVQRVHYTIDVLAAPFFVYPVYVLACEVRNRTCSAS